MSETGLIIALAPLVVNGCIELSNVKRPPVRGGLLYAEAQGNESLLQAPQRRNCVPSRDRLGDANSSIERVHNSNLTGINDRTCASVAKLSPISVRVQSGAVTNSGIFSVRDGALLTKVNARTRVMNQRFKELFYPQREGVDVC